MELASTKVFLWAQAKPPFDSPQTEHPSVFFQEFEIRSSAQQRTSCFSSTAAHLGSSEHLFVRPHST